MGIITVFVALTVPRVLMVIAFLMSDWFSSVLILFPHKLLTQGSPGGGNRGKRGKI